MDAVAFLLTRYELADPASGRLPACSRMSGRQALYVSLVEKGSVSLVEACCWGDDRGRDLADKLKS